MFQTVTKKEKGDIIIDLTSDDGESSEATPTTINQETTEHAQSDFVTSCDQRNAPENVSE